MERVYKIWTRHNTGIIVTSVEDIGVHIEEILENVHNVEVDGDLEIKITVTMMEGSEIDSLPEFDGF